MWMIVIISFLTIIIYYILKLLIFTKSISILTFPVLNLTSKLQVFYYYPKKKKKKLLNHLSVLLVIFSFQVRLIKLSHLICNLIEQMNLKEKLLFFYKKDSNSHLTWPAYSLQLYNFYIYCVSKASQVKGMNHLIQLKIFYYSMQLYNFYMYCVSKAS